MAISVAKRAKWSLRIILVINDLSASLAISS
jgi:hypothetical protein